MNRQKNIYRVEAERLHNIAVEEWKEKNPPKPVENVDTRWQAYVMPSGQIRKPSPFVLFANKNRARVQEMNPSAGFAEIGRKMGEIWHAIDGKTRAIFEKEAIKLKEQATKESKKAKRLAKKNGPKPTKWESYLTTSTGKIRKPSPFVLFANKNRVRVMEMNPELNFAEIGKKLGEIWHKLDGNTRKLFEKEAEKMKKDAMDKQAKMLKQAAKAKGKGKKALSVEEAVAAVFAVNNKSFSAKSKADTSKKKKVASVVKKGKK